MKDRDGYAPIDKSALDTRQRTQDDTILDILVVSSVLTALILGVLFAVIAGSSEAATAIFS